MKPLSGLDAFRKWTCPHRQPWTPHHCQVETAPVFFNIDKCLKLDCCGVNLLKQTTFIGFVKKKTHLKMWNSINHQRHCIQQNNTRDMRKVLHGEHISHHQLSKEPIRRKNTFRKDMNLSSSALFWKPAVATVENRT